MHFPFLTQVEQPPSCSASSRPGRPSPQAARLTERLKDLITDVCDLKQLVIAGGKAVWTVYCDVYVIDDDGSLLDVCTIAALAALRSLTFPNVEMNKEGSVVLSKELSARIPFRTRTLLCPLTLGILDGKLLVDITNEEEGLVDSRIELISDTDGHIRGANSTDRWDTTEPP